MATTQINGTTQIRSGTVPWAAMASGTIVPTASMIDGASFFWKNGSVTATGAFNMGGFKVTNAGAPTASGDLVTKSYVDALVNGFTLHGARVVSTSNIATLSGLLSVDGYTLVGGDVVLLTAQTTASQNGPWVAAAGSWTRPTWWAAASSVAEGNYFIIDPDGTTYKNTKWFVTTVGTITVDTTSVTFTPDNSGTSYSAGTGLSLAGNVFSVNYGTTGTTAAAGNDSRITGALQTSALGTGVQTALGIAAGTGAGFALLSSGVLTAAEFPALTGDVTTTAGSLTTVVNNTASTGFVKYTNFVFNETPGGSVNGSNTTFTLANSPATGSGSISSLELCYNGEVLEPGAGNDYTLSGATITMLFAPVTGDKLRAFYMK